MNTRFYNAKILVLDAENHFSIAEDELHVTGDTITYIGPGRKADPDAAETPVFDREIDARGNLLIPGFKNAHTHTPMTFLRSYADDLPLHEWLERQVFPNEAKLAGDDVYWLNILGIMEYLTSGITSNFDMYIQQKNSIAATVDTGFRTVLTSGLNNFSKRCITMSTNSPTAPRICSVSTPNIRPAARFLKPLPNSPKNTIPLSGHTTPKQKAKSRAVKSAGDSPRHS